MGAEARYKGVAAVLTSRPMIQRVRRTFVIGTGIASGRWGVLGITDALSCKAMLY
jgi:hypothetical protein